MVTGYVLINDDTKMELANHFKYLGPKEIKWVLRKEK